MKLFTSTLMCLLPLAAANSLLGFELNLMPMPAKVTPGQGRLIIDPNFRVAVSGQADGRLLATALRLIERISAQTGIPLSHELASDPAQATLIFECNGPGKPVQQFGEDESYQLSVSDKQARITAPNPLGDIRGAATFAQLVDSDQQGFGVPVVEIEDQPRFPWRGLMLDVSRHWIPIDVVKRNLNAMAAVKMNVLHWHLSDDQGFRIESKKFPKLQELGSDGNFYTQDQVREVIEYARERGIRVVPEFDMPGHTSSWLVGYPELASGPGPYEIGRHWGVYDEAMDPAKESTYKLLDAFIGEMAKLFPDEYFHIGGDEVNGKAWNANPNIQKFMQENGLKDNHALQAYFNRRVQAIVQKHGKHMEGWDEILDPDLPKNIVIQSWRGQKSLSDAARLGYSGLLSHGYYLDLMQPASQHYLVDPMDQEAATLTPDEARRIMGGEACMWTEYASPATIDSRTWPRAAAIAERLWSPRDVRDVASMYRRLAVISRNLDWTGVRHRANYQPMLERLSDGDPTTAVKTLADVVEPVRGYKRGSIYESVQSTPLTRLIDAARPESDLAREFSSDVDAVIAHQGKTDEVRRWLTIWRDNNGRLEPAIEQSFLLRDTAPVSRELSQVAAAGLEALDAVEAGRRLPADWLQQQTALLEEAAKPKAGVMLMVVAPVQKLVNAAAGTAQ